MNFELKYKTYLTIRRDLREAYELINFVIKVQSDMLQKGKVDENIALSAKISFHYTVILYARWFKATKSKIALKPNKFFKEETSKFLDIHQYIIKLRDRYIAHNEEDLLGGDKVIISGEVPFDEFSISSIWEENLIVNAEILNKFKGCIMIVHNYIDKNKIPKYEEYLKKHLKEDGNVSKYNI